MGLIIIAGAIAGFVILVLLARRAGAAVQRRRAGLVAGTMLQLGVTPVAALPDDLPAFELLNTGTNRRATTIHRGSVHGADVVLFDYTFYDRRRVGGFAGLHSSTHFVTATVACAKGSWLNLPSFAIEPSLAAVVKDAESQVEQQLGDSGMAGIAKAVMSIAEGMVGLQSGWRFPDRPDVKYVVRSGDEPAIRGAFTPPILDFFRDHPGWIVEGRGDWVLVTFSGQLRQPELDLRIQRADTGQLPPEKLAALVRAATDTVDAFRAAAR